MSNVVCSAAEAECGHLFTNCQKAIEIKRALEALGKNQQKIEIRTDNSTAASFANDMMRIRRSKIES